MSRQETVTKKDLPEIEKVLGRKKKLLNEIKSEMERAFELKDQIGNIPTKTKEGSGLLGELDEVKDNLVKLQSQSKLDGLRHGRLVFVASIREGRKNLNKKKLHSELVETFAPIVPKKYDVIELINKCFDSDLVTVQGDNFIERDLALLKE